MAATAALPGASYDNLAEATADDVALPLCLLRAVLVKSVIFGIIGFVDHHREDSNDLLTGWADGKEKAEIIILLLITVG